MLCLSYTVMSVMYSLWKGNIRNSVTSTSLGWDHFPPVFIVVCIYSDNKNGYQWLYNCVRKTTETKHVMDNNAIKSPLTVYKAWQLHDVLY